MNVKSELRDDMLENAQDCVRGINIKDIPSA